MPLPPRGTCDAYWMMESKTACTGCSARNWHWFQKYCNLVGTITNEAIDKDDLKSTDFDGQPQESDESGSNEDAHPFDSDPPEPKQVQWWMVNFGQ